MFPKQNTKNRISAAFYSCRQLYNIQDTVYSKWENRLRHKSHTCTHMHAHTFIIPGHDPSVYPTSQQIVPRGKQGNWDVFLNSMCKSAYSHESVRVCVYSLLAVVSFPWLASQHHMSVCGAVLTCATAGGQEGLTQYNDSFMPVRHACNTTAHSHIL